MLPFHYRQADIISNPATCYRSTALPACERPILLGYNEAAAAPIVAAGTHNAEWLDMQSIRTDVLRLTGRAPPYETGGNHLSGFGGRIGNVVTIGTFGNGPMQIGVLVDIGEPLLTIIEPEALDPAPEDPLPPGWAKYNI